MVFALRSLRAANSLSLGPKLIKPCAVEAAPQRAMPCEDDEESKETRSTAEVANSVRLGLRGTRGAPGWTWSATGGEDTKSRRDRPRMDMEEPREGAWTEGGGPGWRRSKIGIEESG